MHVVWSIILSGVVLVTGVAHAEKLQVVATVGMVGDVISSVGGETVNTTTLIGPGLDPHLYKPSRTDMAALLGADMVFYSGLLLEGKMTDALIKVGASGKKVVALTESLPKDRLHSVDPGSEHYDPHVWMDSTLWSETITIANDALKARLPEHTQQFDIAAQEYKDQLIALDLYAQKVLSTVPPSSRVLVTAHDAFQYFGKRYGYEVVGIQGISTESEAGVKDIKRIVDLLVSRKIRAVFVESTVSERNVRALIEGAANQGHSVIIGGQLFSDAMGDAGTYEGTYVGMIDHNVTTITRALGGDAPREGMHGKLTNVK